MTPGRYEKELKPREEFFRDGWVQCPQLKFAKLLELVVTNRARKLTFGLQAYSRRYNVIR